MKTEKEKERIKEGEKEKEKRRKKGERKKESKSGEMLNSSACRFSTSVIHTERRMYGVNALSFERQWFRGRREEKEKSKGEEKKEKTGKKQERNRKKVKDYTAEVIWSECVRVVVKRFPFFFSPWSVSFGRRDPSPTSVLYRLTEE
jgi:hypothetical protein